MQNLNQIPEKTSVFVLDIEGEKREKDRLHTLGVLPEKIITVIKNPQNKSPLIIEADETRFALSKDIAKHIYASHILREHDLIFNAHHKKTQQRTLILQELKKQKGHFSLSEFTKAVHKKDKKIGTITVYRTLKFLTKKGILEILKLSDGSKKFEIKKGHHDHIICENCGSIIEFRNESIENLQKEIAKKHQVKLDSHKLKLFAKSCPDCGGKAK